MKKYKTIDQNKVDTEIGYKKVSPLVEELTGIVPKQDETDYLLSAEANKKRLLENIEVFINGIKNPAKPNQVLKDAAESYKERSYSEEEVIAFGEFIFKHSLLTHTRGVKSLFEQFKKK